MKIGTILLINLIIAFNPDPVSGQENVRNDQKDQLFNLPIRYYQIAQLYGPGMPASGVEGLHQDTMNVNAGKIGLVLVHTWNRRCTSAATMRYPSYGVCKFKSELLQLAGGSHG